MVEPIYDNVLNSLKCELFDLVTETLVVDALHEAGFVNKHKDLSILCEQQNNDLTELIWDVMEAFGESEEEVHVVSTVCGITFLYDLHEHATYSSHTDRFLQKIVTAARKEFLQKWKSVV